MNDNGNKERADFDRVYNDNIKLLIRIAYKITASQEVSEDLCQEAFLRYYEHQHKIDTAIQAKYWLIRVVKNLAFNYQKRKGRKQTAYHRVFKEKKLADTYSGEQALLGKETRDIVQKALMKLPAKLRTVLVLKEYGEHNYKQIGEMLNITEGNVKVRVFRAREKLSQLLEEGDVHVPG